MMTLIVKNEEKETAIQLEKPACLYDVLVANQLIADAPCGGVGKCGKCRVRVMGPAAEATANETKRLSETEIGEGVRLACETTIFADMAVALIQGQSETVTLLTVDGPAQQGETCAAFDIGTTTIEAALVDGISGKERARAVVKNPQVAFGADLFTRMSFAMEDEENTALLSRALTQAMNRLTKAMAEPLGVLAEDIKKAAVSGNTTMLHMLLKEDIRPLAAAPFVTAHLSPDEMAGESIGLLCKKAAVSFSPAASAFLGGDAVLGAAVLGMGKPGQTALLIDLGTNGEMVLAKDGVFTGCSVAAGPAFEGAEMVCGMRAVSGAVSDVWVDEDLQFQTIENARPAGICGSGYIALIAEMVENGIISENGKLTAASALDSLNRRVETAPGGPRFRVTDDSGVFVTQSDIRSFQLAKSAVRSGVEMLMEKHALAPEDLDIIYIAGGFGSNIKQGDLFRCGALPFDHPNILVAGNTSLLGAQRLVTDEDFKQDASALSRKIDVFLLSTQPSFQDRFINNLLFNRQ